MTTTFDPAKLQIALETIHHAGLPGVFAEARAGDETWRGAAGVADLATGRPVTADLRHRVGSITKTFTAAAVLRLVEDGLLSLDTPVGHHLSHLVPGDRGAAITIRMLIEHTSGLADLLPHAYPSLAAFPDLTKTTPASLDDHRFTRFVPADLIALGVAAPATGAPGGRPGVYSNTNYLLLCELITAVTGLPAREYITAAVIEPAGLRDTELPTGPELDGPHSLHYESWFGMIDPPRDYSVYDMSWVGPAASLISTVADLNRFFRLLMAGAIIDSSSLEQMRRTGPVVSFEGKIIEYGLGVQKMTLPGTRRILGPRGFGLGRRRAVLDQRRRHAAAVGRGEHAALERTRRHGKTAAPPHRPCARRLRRAGLDQLIRRRATDRR